MADIGVGSGLVIGTAWAGRKLLGPLFDEMAEDWRSRYSERRKRNLNAIGQNARAKVGSAIDEEGQIPPRVGAKVLDEGSWCDGPVMAEYFGGILAASRSADGEDDRGASWAGIVLRLSRYDVYLHYLVYEAFRRLYLGAKLNLGLESQRESCRFYLPGGELLKSMGLVLTPDNYHRVLQPSLNALVREDLVGKYHYQGPPQFLATEAQAPGAPDLGIITVPSPAGIELFLWAHGRGDLYTGAVLDPTIEIVAQEDLGQVQGAQTVTAMRDRETERLEKVGFPTGSGS